MSIKSQSALEFIVLASFMLFVILGFLAITTSKTLEVREEANRKIAEDVANFAYREIEIAKSANDGYTRVFIMPLNVNGIAYSINVTDNRELIVAYLGHEYIKFLPANVSGNLSIGRNEIRKLSGILYLRNIIECKDEIDNDGDSFIDYPSDSGCESPQDNDESNCGDAVCEGYESCISCVPDCGACPILQFLIRNKLFNVMSFDVNGNAVLRGSLEPNPNPQQTADDEFVVKDTNGNNVAIINLVTGNMIIKGSLRENEPTLTPPQSSNDFVVKDDSGNVISYIDESGNFYLKGTLTQGNP